MRALVLAAALIGCGGTGARAHLASTTCQVWVYAPNLPPYLWTCTSGAASLSAGRPDHVACVESTEPLWTMVDGGTAVPTCATCTPAALLRLDQSAKCTPLGEEETPAWYPRDMTL